eukprot:scaffold4498_cov119-Isochrysis_galbana.AAC.53
MLRRKEAEAMRLAPAHRGCLQLKVQIAPLNWQLGVRHRASLAHAPPDAVQHLVPQRHVAPRVVVVDKVGRRRRRRFYLDRRLSPLGNLGRPARRPAINSSSPRLGRCYRTAVAIETLALLVAAAKRDAEEGAADRQVLPRGICWRPGCPPTPPSCRRAAGWGGRTAKQSAKRGGVEARMVQGGEEHHRPQPLC